MVYTINDPYSGNVLGRLGKGIGQGISDTLPGVVRRERLASAIEGSEKEKNPFKQQASIIRGGGTPEYAAQLIPQIRNQQQLRAFEEEGNEKKPSLTLGGEQTMSAQQPKTINAAHPEEQPEVTSLPKNSPEWRKEVQNFKQTLLQNPDSDQINDLARQYIRDGRFQNVKEAQLEAKDYLQGKYDAQEKQLADLKSELSERMALDLQKAGLGDFQDLPGTIQKNLVDLAYMRERKQGKTRQAAADEVSDIIDKLGKTATQAKKTGAFTFWSKSPEEKARAYREQKREFDKYGFGDNFAEVVAAAEDVSPEQAASILEPKKSKDVQKSLDKIGASYQAGWIPDPEMSNLYLDEVIKKIKPEDNILSIANDLKDYKINLDQFVDKVNEYNDAGIIHLDDRQRKQLKEPIGNSNLGDILFKAFSKITKPGEPLR